MRSIVKLETRHLRLRTWNRRFVNLMTRRVDVSGAKLPPLHANERSPNLQIEWLARHHEWFGFGQYVVERRRDGAILGMCGITHIDDRFSGFHGLPELGWCIQTGAKGDFIAFEAAAAVLHDFFAKNKGFNVICRVAADDEMAQSLLRRLGLQRQLALDKMRERIFAVDSVRWTKVSLDIPNTGFRRRWARLSKTQ